MTEDEYYASENNDDEELPSTFMADEYIENETKKQQNTEVSLKDVLG